MPSRLFRPFLLVLLFGVGLTLSATAASAAEPPTSCQATVNADLDISVTVTGAGSEVAIDGIGNGYIFFGRFDVESSTQTFVFGLDEGEGFVAPDTNVEIRTRSIDPDGSRSSRISCGSFLPGAGAGPDDAPGSPAFCFFRADADPALEGFLLNDVETNRVTYNRLILEQRVNGTWQETETIFIGGIGDQFFLAGLETAEGLFDVDDPTLPTRMRGQYKDRAADTTVDSPTATICDELPTTPPTLTPPTCATSPSFYLGADGSRRILGVKAANGEVSTDDFIWEGAPLVSYRYLDADGTVVRESVDSKWKDVPVGTYTVQVRTELPENRLLRFPLIASDWVTCGTETVS